MVNERYADVARAYARRGRGASSNDYILDKYRLQRKNASRLGVFNADFGQKVRNQRVQSSLVHSSRIDSVQARWLPEAFFPRKSIKKERCI